MRMDILLTGANGFLGRYIFEELSSLNQIDTLGRSNSSYNIDLSKQLPVFTKNYEVIIHNAGKAHCVPKTVNEKQKFYDVNVNGTLNLLKSFDKFSNLPKAFVFISSVAVYGCDYGLMINEDHPLKAHDPYGESKIQAEQLVKNWCLKNNVICTILRLPLLVGENPPGNLGAMIKGIKKGYYFNIANGKAKKSMVLASDVAKIIEISALKGGVYNLTDGYNPSFKELSFAIAKQLDKVMPLNLPLWIAKVIAYGGNLLGTKAPINSKKLDKIISDLTFDDTKAKKQLNWNPNPVLNEFKIKIR